jgi:hypothetical protein
MSWTAVNDTRARAYRSNLLASGEASRIASSDDVIAGGASERRGYRSGRVSGDGRRRGGCGRQNARHDGRDETVDPE